MSLDSKEKRASIFGVGRPWMRDMFPVAAPDEEWRISCGNAYGGNALSVALAHEITIDFATSLSGEVDGTRKVVATLTPGDDAVVYVFEETEVS